ncbi:MAG TPA: helix-turn-helix transcriptional regulator [Pseudonocardiaceae bacterium]|nr:helix-turn-helix transcriptional regulator [Pseudonocardiaceae bacterium]
MPHRDSTVRSRELGDGLRAAMERAGLNGKQTARALGWSESFVSMILNGKRNASEVDIAAFLGVCRVKGAERERLLALCREQDTPGWFQPHGARLPKQLITLIDHESKATTISEFGAVGVPGLLQTGEYARAVISRIVNVPPGEVNDRVAARLARQSLFARDRAAQFTFYLHESVLRTPVGGPAVMAEQLHHLHRMSARSYLTVRVVPIALGAHPAMAGAFTLMEFTEFKPVVYLESETTSAFLEKPEEIQAYRNILAALAETALSEGQSQELIAALATELYANGEDHDDRA